MTRYDELVGHIRNGGPAAIAFSGGVDSTFLARACHDALGDRALAVTVISAAYPPDTADDIAEIAAGIGIRLVAIPVDIADIPRFTDNPPDRCYHCKLALLRLIRDRATVEGINRVFDGSNADDAGDYRPGHRALRELGIESPLLDLGFTKAEIRELSRGLGLPTWDLPSYACLASRFPYGERITLEGLERTWRAEALLHCLGFTGSRVRNHGGIARIEVRPADIAHFLDTPVRERIVTAMKELGYAYVALDLEGYRTGSMNEVL